MQIAQLTTFAQQHHTLCIKSTLAKTPWTDPLFHNSPIFEAQHSAGLVIKLCNEVCVMLINISIHVRLIDFLLLSIRLT